MFNIYIHIFSSYVYIEKMNIISSDVEINKFEPLGTKL